MTASPTATETERRDITIRGVRATPVIAPLVPPMTTAAGSLTESALLLVDLETREGVSGRAYLFGYSRFTLAPLRSLVESLGEMASGEPLAPVDLEAKLRRRFALFGDRGLAGMALSAFDMAAWDALARAANLPLVRLLGGTPRPLRAYKSLGMLGPAAAAEAAVRAVDEGFPGMKIKIGWPTLEEDMAAVRAARSRMPDPMALMVDFNQSLPAAEAVRRSVALDGEGLAWIEEPVRAGDYAGAAEVARAVTTPIQIGENFMGPFEMEDALRAGACDEVMPDPQQIGGVTGWLRAAALAQAAGRSMSGHIFIEPTAHLLAVTPTAGWLEWLDVASPVLAEPFRLEAGHVTAPERAGLGLSWDPEAVARYSA